ncbi:hypothetical protein BYT27DRAFT_7299169 [Phlegmacium glaucopus]|nr:hypothetical protein BYT27DRAFT_7299169 [Phlegmacium glaucopus]
MDRTKDKGRSARNAASTPIREGTPVNSQRGLATRSDVNTLIAGNPGPVTNISDARRWLESKGWVLSGEEYDRSKIAKILLTVSLLPKMPPEAVSAIRASAFILEDDIADKASTLIASTVANKVNESLANVLTELAATRSFFEASSTQQANTTLSLKEIATQNDAAVASLTDAASKIAASSAPTDVPTSINWPSLPSFQPSQPSLPLSSHDPNSPPSVSRLQQRLLLAARTVLVHVESDDVTAPADRSPAALKKICQEINDNLAELDEDDSLRPWEPSDNPKPKTLV